MLMRHVHDTEADAEAVRAITAAAFDDPPDHWPHERAVRYRRRVRHLARTDPGGCWIALDEAGGDALGVALALRREGTWGLSLFAVVPHAQGKGVGRALLDRATLYGRGCLRGLICASSDPRAARRYRKAGFTLHPAMRLSGVVEDRTGLPDPDGIPVHPGSAHHLHLLDSVDRRLRGGAHGPDHEELLRHHRLLVADTLVGSGYCYLRDGRVELLAATSRRLATRLLTEALLLVPHGTEVTVADLTAEQDWAIDVGMAAGLTLSNAGYLCVRGMRPPAPYIPSDAFL
ncbi:GCN5 family acetyltransferase [Wenjunlia vitaminophila]|uniref:GCN5 family acetyltransferase n=1 Tax=Wenjunlia vitaminophila TaxID=76728 RepID=A0A0T6LUS8_WENVI|nr:GNAT family N-acetyltransferase [Wenjunlia vitaminophila]KRV49911.1 GCN5 family acetyltransferase [Wenjunlia vitaminophila]